MPKKPTSPLKKYLIISALVLVPTVATVIYFYFFNSAKQAIPNHLPAQKNISAQSAATIPQATTQPPISPPAETESVVNEHYRQAPMATHLKDPCLTIIKKLDAFFLYLDQQNYIKKYQFPEGSKIYLGSLIKTLLNSPPRSINEPLSTLNQMGNNAHLFRTIGSQNIAIIRTIMANEPDKIEEILADLYSWYTSAAQCQNRVFTISPDLAKLAPYAVFFLNSSAGQAYLLRRNNKIRLLATYYSILIIQQNQKNAPVSSDLDTTKLIGKLISEIEASNELVNKNNYLSILYKLREKSLIL